MSATFSIQIPKKFQQSTLFQGALFISQQLKKSGFEALYAGGAVRDLLLERAPADIDIATNAHPKDIKKIFKRTIPVGAQFGVMLVIVHKITYEVATYRGDGKYLDGRRPSEVHFTDAKNDAQRRDFTVNGMFIDPENELLIDYVNGIKDLKEKLIRTIGSPENRFFEDRLRMLRAIRFAFKLDFRIHDDTMKAIQKMAAHISSISAERIQEELIKTLSINNLDLLKYWKIFDSSGLMQYILPEIFQQKNINKQIQDGKKINLFEFSGKSLSYLSGLINKHKRVKKTFHLPFAGLLQCIENTDIESKTIIQEESAKVMKRLKFSNMDIQIVSAILSLQNSFQGSREKNLITIKKWFQNEHFLESLMLFQARQLTLAQFKPKLADLNSFDYLMMKFESLTRNEIFPPELVNGQDLIQMGLKPGPLFSKILAKIEEQQLLGAITSKKEAIKFIHENFKD